MKGFGLQISDEQNDLKIVVTRDSNGIITSGLFLGDITYQNMNFILSIHAGEIKDNPTIGIGITDITLDEDLLEWRMKIRQALENDGLVIKELIFDNPEKIFIDGYYS